MLVTSEILVILSSKFILTNNTAVANSHSEGGEGCFSKKKKTHIKTGFLLRL
jgi:hypothetical protein